MKKSVSSLCDVLCIEDDPTLSQAIQGELSRAGLSVTCVNTGKDAFDALKTKKFDVITLDRVLPDCDGLAFLAKIRGENITTPVIMISGMGSVADRVAGLKAGSDDYITKPFASEEMIARVEVVLRRQDPGVSSETSIEIGDLHLNLVDRHVYCRGQNISLKGTEFKLLELLMRNCGRLITRAFIFEVVWGYDFDPGTKLIDVHLSSLRRKLEQLGSQIQINNIRGAGFVLEAQ
ncbi:DNA-binding response regulator [Chimaeribacter californicus]|uniref:DNA-binding response regulator n=1 Tax=Chimaeribacter californicus TaxID=2060067 RepID=A0A2N5EC32_9GAMM|nr:response regulator transcription factor [Chimaeribacter californicus]PLR39670.1 DNA-binding response regulator [Chimaeribacter californicus]